MLGFSRVIKFQTFFSLIIDTLFTFYCYYFYFLWRQNRILVEAGHVNHISNCFQYCKICLNTWTLFGINYDICQFCTIDYFGCAFRIDVIQCYIRRLSEYVSLSMFSYLLFLYCSWVL